MAFADYRGLQLRTVAPTGTGGLPLHNDLVELADRAGPIFSAAADPTVNDDSADNAGNGKFYLWSKWLNSTNKSVFICVDATPTAAVWRTIHYSGMVDVALFSNKIALTQTDGNEYIDSLADGYLDLGATTSIRNQAPVLMTDKVSFTQTDGNEYIDSLNDGYLDLGATTQIRHQAPTLMLDKLSFTQIDNNEYIDSANDGYLDIVATTSIRNNSPTLMMHKLYFTQTDGDEYIDSVADGYLDLFATTEIRFNSPTLMMDKVSFTQIDGDEYIDSAADGYLDLGATTSIRFNNTFQQSSSTSGGGLQQYMSEAVGTATAATSFNIEVNVPADAKILGCQLRVDVALTSGDGGVSWEAEFLGGVAASLGSAYAFAKDTQAAVMFDENAGAAIDAAETDIKITCDSAKNFAAGGKVRAIVYYQELIPMDAAP